MTEKFLDLMRSATQLTQTGRLQAATEMIQRLLQGGGASAPTAAFATQPGAGRSTVLDGCVSEVAAPLAPAANDPAPRVSPQGVDAVGLFASGEHRHGAVSHAYKLYTPPGAQGRHLPLVVMLHGCTQDCDDFAAGTGMNDLARELGFLVLYPAQSQSANPQRCWNWFKHSHQQRGRGEPAWIASLTQDIVARHGVDKRRVYIAGLSAGGAMATNVAELYPEIFAAAGVHSGLARGAAANLGEAMAAMQGHATAAAAAGPAAAQVPTIVFHGADDMTVHPHNGEQVFGAAPRGGHGLRVEQGAAGGGRRYSRQLLIDAQGRVRAEHWLVHGSGHAWSGGRAAGSYTDPQGPDASREMLRFFLAHPHTRAG